MPLAILMSSSRKILMFARRRKALGVPPMNSGEQRVGGVGHYGQRQDVDARRTGCL